MNTYIYTIQEGKGYFKGPLGMEKPEKRGVTIAAQMTFEAEIELWNQHIERRPSIEYIGSPSDFKDQEIVSEDRLMFHTELIRESGLGATAIQHKKRTVAYEAEQQRGEKDNVASDNKDEAASTATLHSGQGNAIEQEKDESPYCKICSACGEEGCCPASKCMQHPEGYYCQHYLLDLKFGYRLQRRLINKIDEESERYADLIKWYDAEHDKLYNEVYDTKPTSQQGSSSGNNGQDKYMVGEWQICPKCGGTKQLPAPFEIDHTGCIKSYCVACNEHGLIARPLMPLPKKP